MAYAGASAPSGWLLCNGAAINRTTYATLFGIIGETYGEGDSNTTFNLPDLRGRFPLGLDNMGGTSADRVAATQADTRGGSSGAETHTLTIAEMPKHSHGIDHVTRDTNGGLAAISVNHVGSNTILTSLANESAQTPGDDSDTVGGFFIKNRGSGSAHNNMPPYLSLNYIIKT